MNLPKTAAAEEPLRIEDLRPELGRLNYQLRRIGLNVRVYVDDGVVVRAELVGDASAWYVDCAFCGTRYDPARAAKPTCPQCGLADVDDAGQPHQPGCTTPETSAPSPTTVAPASPEPSRDDRRAHRS